MSKPELERLQTWMQEVITLPGGIDAALDDARMNTCVDSDEGLAMLLPSRTLDARERLGIYYEMYFLRMREALAFDFPGVEDYLGETGFDDLVRGYVDTFPSRSFTLNRLGDHLPKYIGERDSLEGRSFLVDLSRYELAVTHVFDGEQDEALTSDEIAAVPADAWSRARLVPRRAFALLELDHPVTEYLHALRHDLPRPRPRRRASRLAVYREDYRVQYQDLDRDQYRLLEALVAGTPLGDALEGAIESMASKQAEERVFSWFSRWVEQGLFRSVELS